MNSNQVPDTTGEESPYVFVENYRGVEITHNGKVYHAMVYNSDTQQSHEFCREKLGDLVMLINAYMCQSYYQAIKDLLWSFGLKPDDYRLHDSESIQEAIKTKISNEIVNTIDNLNI